LYEKLKGGTIFLLSEGIFKRAKKVVEELLATGGVRGESPFSPEKPIMITTDSSLVGNMASFELGGKDFYFGFERKQPQQRG